MHNIIKNRIHVTKTVASGNELRGGASGDPAVRTEAWAVASQAVEFLNLRLWVSKLGFIGFIGFSVFFLARVMDVEAQRSSDSTHESLDHFDLDRFRSTPWSDLFSS